MLGLCISEQAQDPHALLIQPAHGAQQGRLLVQHLPAVGAEHRRDVQGLVLHEGVGGGIPGGVAPGLKGGPQAAGREGGGIRLAPGQLLAGQLHDDRALAVGGDKAVVLLGGDAGHGLEPMGVMGGAQLRGPVLHGRGDLVGNGTLQGGTLGHALPPSFVGVGGQALSHFVLIKDHAAEQFRDVFDFFVHCKLLSPPLAAIIYNTA